MVFIYLFILFSTGDDPMLQMPRVQDMHILATMNLDMHPYDTNLLHLWTEM